MKKAKVLITRSNFGCGSSREHAVWALEVNDINVVIGESFARIFRQNMFNCGILAVELPHADLEELFQLEGSIEVGVDMKNGKITATSPGDKTETLQYDFSLNPFDQKLVQAGGWLAYADANY